MSKPIKCVLLTNDDGWREPGLKVMEEIAHQIAEEVWIISPDLDQSGVSMSITLHSPLRVHHMGERRLSVSGTPSDCVLLAVGELMPEPPDLVLSGVNAGANISDSVAYSGTIGGALTATLMGIPAIALSLAYHKGDEMHWDSVRQFGPGVVRQLLEKGWPDDCAMNVNFPACPADQVTGVATCRARAGSIGGINIESRRDTRDIPYFWLGFQRQTERITGLDTDVGALRANRISISPLRFEREIASWQIDAEAMSSKLGIKPRSEAAADSQDNEPSIDH
jgi:5'-nucleotidase